MGKASVIGFGGVPSPAVKTTNLASCAAGTAIAQDASHVYLACQDAIVRVPK